MIPALQGINVVTGLPGHGKTLYTIAFVRELAKREGCAVFQHGITGLKLPWPEHEPQKWQELPAGSIFIVDEAWKHFPLRGRGEPPEWLGMLAQVRHSGVRLVLINQDPMSLDTFIRRRAGLHLHVMRKFGSKWATIHEYPTGVNENVIKSRGQSIRHEWRYATDVYELYQSAEVHTVKRSIPARIWLLLSLPFIIGGALWYGWTTFSKTSGQDGSKPAGQVAGQGLAAGVPVGSAGGTGGGTRVMTAIEYADQHVPRVAGLAYTAPVFDAVTKPVEAPYPAACIKSPTRCQCYSQQGTKLDMQPELCSSIAAGGFFVSWQRPAERAVPVADKPAAPELAGTHGFNTTDIRLQPAWSSRK